MKYLLLLLNVAWFYLAADQAHAAFIPVAIAAVSNAIGALGIIGKLLVTLVLNVATSLLQKALAKKQKVPGVKLDIDLGDDKPVSTTIGTYATSGRRKYIGTCGSSHKYLVDVIELGSIPNPNGISGFWLNDTHCVFPTNPADNVLPQGWDIAESREGQTTLAWIKYYDGTQTAADPWLVSQFGSDPDHPWTADMVGYGIPYVIMTYRFRADKWSSVPQALFEMRPISLYDARKDSTNGGNGSHRWEAPSTWEPSNNKVVMIYNVIRGIYYGNEWMFGGQNLAASRLPSSSWIAAANESDRLIDVVDNDDDNIDPDEDTNGNGTATTERQFRGGFEITGDTEPLDVIDDFRAGCSGRIAEVGGAFKAQVGAFGAPVFAFTDDDIIITKSQSYKPFPTLDDTYNIINATYPEPDEKWGMKDAPEFADAALQVADGNRPLPADVQFPSVPYKYQVQRLMRAMLLEERRFRIHEFYLPPDAWALEPNDVVSWSSARNGYASKQFLVDAISGEMTMNQLVRLKEIDPSDYDWSSSYQLPTSTGWIGDLTPPPRPMTGWAVESATIPDANGVDRRPAIKVSCASDLDNIKRVWVQVRLQESQAVVFDNDSNAYAPPYAWLLSGNWCLPATVYEVRGKYIPFTGLDSNWSAWLAVTTDDIRLGISDIDVTALGAAISDFFSAGQAWANSSIRAIIVEQQRVARLIIDQDFSKTTDKQQLLTQLTSTTGLITAAYTEAVTVATGPTSAIVQRLTTIEAQIPGLAEATVVDALTSRVDTTETGITALAGRTTTIETALPGKASADGLASLVTTVSSQGDTITAQGLQITSISTDLAGKASSDSVSSLSATVSEQGEDITANGEAITSVNTTVGNFSASGLFRTTVEATPSGALSRIGLSAAASAGSSTVEAAIYLTAMASGKAIASVLADQFVILNPDGSGGFYQPFVYEGGVMYVANAKIQQAQIDDLMVDKSNISPGAVSRIDHANAGNIAIGSSNTAVIGITSFHGTDLISVLVTACFSIAGDAGTITVVISVWDSYNNAYGAIIPMTFTTQTHFSHSFDFTPAAGQTSTDFRFDVRVLAGTNVKADNRTVRADTSYR